MDVFVIVAAFAAGMLARWVRLPTLVGYLAAGLVLSLLGQEVTPLIKGVGDLGVMLLLFTVGLHIRPRSLMQAEVLGVGLIHLALSAVMYTAIMLVIGVSTLPAVLVGVALGFSSTVLTAKSLEARDELDSYHGRIAIGILILQDVVAVVLLVFTGAGTPSPWAFLLLGLPLLRPLLFWLMKNSGREEVLILYGLMLAVGVGFIFELVGLDAKLGALVAGLLLSGTHESDLLYDQLWGLKEVFLVGFFLQVGLAGLPRPEDWPTVLLLLAFLPVKAILFFVLLVAFRLRARTAFMSTVALTAYSEFALITVAAAAESGLADPALVSLSGMVVALSFAINAPISSFANPLWTRLEPYLVRYERHVPDHPDQDPRTLGSSDFVIVGMGRAGSAAYDHLKGYGARPVGLDSDPGQIADGIAAGRRVLYGDANDNELWTDLEISRIHGVMLALPNAAAMAAAARNLRKEGYTRHISALLRNDETADAEALEEAGVNTMFLPMEQAGRDLADVCLVSWQLEQLDKQDEAGGTLPPGQATASA